MTKVGGESCNPSLDYEVRPCDYFGQLDVSMNPVAHISTTLVMSGYRSTILFNNAIYVLSRVPNKMNSFVLTRESSYEEICKIDMEDSCRGMRITVTPSYPGCNKMTGVLLRTSSTYA